MRKLPQLLGVGIVLLVLTILLLIESQVAQVSPLIQATQYVTPTSIPPYPTPTPADRAHMPVIFDLVTTPTIIPTPTVTPEVKPTDTMVPP